MRLIITDLVDANPDPDVSDQYYIDYDPHAYWQQQDGGASEFGGSEMYDDPGSVAPSMGEWAEGEGDYAEGDGEGEPYDGEDLDGEGEDEEAFDQ